MPMRAYVFSSCTVLHLLGMSPIQPTASLYNLRLVAQSNNTCPEVTDDVA